MNKKQLIEEIKEMERKVEELKKSIPIHSPKVPMIQELEDLEEKLNAKRKMLSKTENTMEISERKERLEREREEKDKFFFAPSSITNSFRTTKVNDVSWLSWISSTWDSK